MIPQISSDHQENTEEWNDSKKFFCKKTLKLFFDFF